MGLGLTLALAAGKKKPAGPPLSPAQVRQTLEQAGIPPEVATAIERRAEEMVVSPGLPPMVPRVPTTPAKEPAYDWSGWIASKIMGAMQSHSVDTARAAAHALEAQAAQPGVPPDASSLMIQGAAALRSAALSWEQETRAREAAVSIPVSIPTQLIPEPILRVPTAPTAPLPPVEQIIPIVKHTAQKTLAIAVNTMLNMNGGAPANRYQEDRNLVKAYQAQEGLTPDGLYGVGTGLSMVGYNLIPAKPYYFSKIQSKMLASKERWKNEMLRMASIDPARALQWEAASDIRSL